jgi:hypoxanthine-guanine phosphoribosyltransferase
MVNPGCARVLGGLFVIVGHVPALLLLCTCFSSRSYGAGFETSGTVQVSFDKEAVVGRHCIMVDDLCDSGLTLLTVSGCNS